MTEQKKRRKAARRRVDRPVFCPPDAAGRSPLLRILGTICRLVTIFCAAYGLSSLVLSAFFPSADMEPVLLVTFVVVMLVALIAVMMVLPYILSLVNEFVGGFSSSNPGNVLS